MTAPRPCRAPVIVRINNNDLQTQVWCVEPKGHTGEHRVPISWPNDGPGVILDVEVKPS